MTFKVLNYIFQQQLGLLKPNFSDFSDTITKHTIHILLKYLLRFGKYANLLSFAPAIFNGKFLTYT